jgi:hypothetical protein
MKIRKGIAGIAIAILPVTGAGIALATANSASASPNCTAIDAQIQALRDDLNNYNDQLGNVETQLDSTFGDHSIILRIDYLWLKDVVIPWTTHRINSLSAECTPTPGGSGNS